MLSTGAVIVGAHAKTCRRGSYVSYICFNLEKILSTLQSLVSVMGYDNLEKKKRFFFLDELSTSFSAWNFWS